MLGHHTQIPPTLAKKGPHMFSTQTSSGNRNAHVMPEERAYIGDFTLANSLP